MTPTPFAAVLLAGGKSRRMGRDKALLPLPDGRLLWQRQLSVLEELGPTERYISGFARPGFPPEARVLADTWPDAGPLGGIAAALTVMHTPLLVVLAIDLPAMTAGFLRRLLAQAERDGKGVVPRHAGAAGYYEPLAAVYPRECLPLATERLAGGQLRMQEFVRAAGEVLQPLEIAVGEEPLFANWNHPLPS